MPSLRWYVYLILLGAITSMNQKAEARNPCVYLRIQHGAILVNIDACRIRGHAYGMLYMYHLEQTLRHLRNMKKNKKNTYYQRKLK